MLNLTLANIFIQKMRNQKNQEALSHEVHSKFRAFQIQRKVCYSPLFFFDLSSTFEQNLTPVIQHQFHQTDQQACHSLLRNAEGFYRTLQFIRTYDFQNIHKETIICPQCIIGINDLKLQMIGFLGGERAGSCPFEAIKMKCTKTILYAIIRVREDSFVNRCHPKTTEPTQLIFIQFIVNNCLILFCKFSLINATFSYQLIQQNRLITFLAYKIHQEHQNEVA